MPDIRLPVCSERMDTNQKGSVTYLLISFQGVITEDSPAQGNVPDNVVCKSINEAQCSEEVMLLTDELWQYAKDSYRNNTITVICGNRKKI